MKPLIRKADIEYFSNCYDNYLQSEVNNVISDKDVMFWNTVHEYAQREEIKVEESANVQTVTYFGIGQEVAHEVIIAGMNSYLKQVNNVLDLACGHGRGTRHLVNLFPNAKVYAADIDRNGVDFCVNQFGVEGIYLPDDLGEYDFGINYDIIWSGSLFTHHPRERVKRWISHLSNFLSDNGIFVFTVNTSEILKYNFFVPNEEFMKDYDETGYAFHIHDERYSLQGQGFSITTPSAVVEDINEIENVRVLSYREASWIEIQDVVSIGKPSYLDGQHYELPRPMVLLPNSPRDGV